MSEWSRTLMGNAERHGRHHGASLTAKNWDDKAGVSTPSAASRYLVAIIGKSAFRLYPAGVSLYSVFIGPIG